MDDRESPGPRRCVMMGAWVFPLVVCIVANVSYLCLSWIPNHKYLKWAEARPQCQEHLPDVLLDLHDGGQEASTVTAVADSLPVISIVVTGIACFCAQNLLVWNRFLLTQSLVILLNTTAEQVTVIPSSYGFRRCKAFLGINSSADDRFGFSLTGSCAAMIWSGHVFHVMIGGYMLGLVLESRYPWMRRRSCWGTPSAPLLKSLIVVGLAICEMSVLVLDKGHYSVDMFLATLISMLIFTNDNVTYWVFRFNPFIRHVIHPTQQPIKHGALREALRSFQSDSCDGLGLQMVERATPRSPMPTSESTDTTTSS